MNTIKRDILYKHTMAHKFYEYIVCVVMNYEYIACVVMNIVVTNILKLHWHCIMRHDYHNCIDETLTKV